jgi:hypothetical protein
LELVFRVAQDLLGRLVALVLVARVAVVVQADTAGQVVLEAILLLGLHVLLLELVVLVAVVAEVETPLLELEMVAEAVVVALEC